MEDKDFTNYIDMSEEKQMYLTFHEVKLIIKNYYKKNGINIANICICLDTKGYIFKCTYYDSINLGFKSNKKVNFYLYESDIEKIISKFFSEKYVIESINICSDKLLKCYSVEFSNRELQSPSRKILIKENDV